jgi:hypothetical protein
MERITVVGNSECASFFSLPGSPGDAPAAGENVIELPRMVRQAFVMIPINRA